MSATGGTAGRATPRTIKVTIETEHGTFTGEREVGDHMLAALEDSWFEAKTAWAMTTPNEDDDGLLTRADATPKIPSREARYEAVMKYHERILETGSAEPESSPLR